MNFRNIFLYFSILLLVINCKKEGDIGTIGKGMMPPEDILTTKHDSITSFNCSYNFDLEERLGSYNLLLGSYIDPVFGKASAEILAPMYFDSPVIDNSKQNTVKINSVTLLLIDSSFQYGIKSPQVIKLNKVLVDVYTSPSNTSGLKTIDTIASLVLDTMYNDTTTYIFNENVVAIFRNFISDTTKYNINLDVEKINKNFFDIFKGIHLEPDASNKGIVKLRDMQILINASVCYETGDCKDVVQKLYPSEYTNATDAVYQPLITFNLNQSQTIIDNVGKENQSKIYLQPMKGLKAQIRLDQMDRWLDSQNVVINAAKLILPIERDPAFAPIPKIQLRVDNSLYYNSQILDDKSSYKIFITSFLRDFINKKKKTREYVFELITPANNTYINRSIIKADEISLDIIYTKYR